MRCVALRVALRVAVALAARWQRASGLKNRLSGANIGRDL